jgi:hypothetical protein
MKVFLCNLGVLHPHRKTYMILIVQRYARRTVLAMMLLLAASANCLSVSYDTNENDDIPPVKIHLCFVASGSHVTVRERSSDSGNGAIHNLVKSTQDSPVAADVEQGFSSLNAGSPSLVVPLRR